MNETPTNIHPLLLEIGKACRLVLEKLSASAPPSPDSIEVDYFGKLPLSALDLWFQIVWQMNGWPGHENLLVVIEPPFEAFFSLEVRNGRVSGFGPVENPDQPEKQHILRIDVNALAPAAEKGILPLIIAVLRGEGVESHPNDFSWKKLAYRLSVSPSGLETIGRWLFPYAGVSIVFRLGEKTLPFIFYGGTPIRLRMLEAESLEFQPEREFLQRFRHEHRLAMAFCFSISHLSIWLQGESALWDIVSSYGEGWTVSVPLEINDFIFNLPWLIRFLPGQEVMERCRLDHKHLSLLFQSYLENGVKHIAQHPIYLKLKDNKECILLEIRTSGLYEVIGPKEIDTGDLFQLDVETFSRVAAWLNDTSLRLMTRFIDAIIPAEIAQKIDREEILIALKLKKGKQTFHLFVSGGEHGIPEPRWSGDCCCILMDQKRQKIVWMELLADTPLDILIQEDRCDVHLPRESSLSSTMNFKVLQKGKFDHGLSRVISNTSIFSEIAPGLRGELSFGELCGMEEIEIGEERYTIERGSFFCARKSGRILKHHGMVRYITHLWLGERHSGLLQAAFPSQKKKVPQWWKDFVEKSEQGALMLRHDGATEFDAEECVLPRLSGKRIETKAHPFPAGFSKNDIGASFRFEIMDVYAVPFDRRGNFLIRIRAMAKSKHETAFALLELPFSVDNVLETDCPLSIQVEAEEHGFAFFSGGKKVLFVETEEYLSLFREGWGWKKKKGPFHADERRP